MFCRYEVMSGKYFWNCMIRGLIVDNSNNKFMRLYYLLGGKESRVLQNISCKNCSRYLIIGINYKLKLKLDIYNWIFMCFRDNMINIIII